MTKLYKFISWGVAIVVFSWLFWNEFNRLAGELSSDVNSFSFFSGFSVNVIIYFLVLAVLICFGIMFFEKIWQVLLIWIFIGGIFLLTNSFSVFNLLTVGILLPLLFYARLNIASESKERTKINARIVLSRGLTPIFIALLLMASFVIYQSPSVKALERANRIPPAGEKFVNSIINNFIGSQIEGSVKEKQSVIQEISRQTIGQINAIVGPYFRYAPPVLSAVIFLILLGFHGIFVLLGVAIGSLLFFILKKARFVRIEEREAIAETLII